MPYYVVGYVERTSNRNVNYPVDVFENEDDAVKAADERWEELKSDNEELVDDAELEEEDMENADADREIEFSDDRIAVDIDTVDNFEQLIGYFKGKAWYGPGAFAAMVDKFRPK